jgi:hypothetical protein
VVIALEVHICDQRRSYVARFQTADQALDFMARRMPSSGRYELDPQQYPYGNHAICELEAEPLVPPAGPVGEDVLRLLDVLYPQCEHGLSLDLCAGPGHYPPDM